MVLNIIKTFVLCTSCFDPFCWVVLIASGFMVSCGRDSFLIQLNSCRVSGPNPQIQPLPGEALGDRRRPHGDRLPGGRVGRGSSLAPALPPPLTSCVPTLDSVPGTRSSRWLVPAVITVTVALPLECLRICSFSPRERGRWDMNSEHQAMTLRKRGRACQCKRIRAPLWTA